MLLSQHMTRAEREELDIRYECRSQWTFTGSLEPSRELNAQQKIYWAREVKQINAILKGDENGNFA